MGAPQELPFPRGSTWNQGGGNGLTLSATLPPITLEGRVFEVPDTEHNLGGVVKLRVVRNDTGSALVVARKFAEFASAAAGDYGRKVDTFPADTAGAVCKPVDDAYAVGLSIAANDLFYVVEAGPCNVTTEASSVSLAAGAAVATDASGLVNGAAATEAEFIVGTMDAASEAESTAVLIHVLEGIRPAAVAAAG